MVATRQTAKSRKLKAESQGKKSAAKVVKKKK
jgi:hypothetical protein